MKLKKSFKFICLATLIPKGLMVFLEFWSLSYGMSLQPSLFISLGLILLFEINPNM